MPNLACLLPCFSLISIFDSFKESASSHGMMADDRAPVTRNSPSLRLRGLARGWIIDCYTVPWLNRIDRTSSGTHLRPLRKPHTRLEQSGTEDIPREKPSHPIRPASNPSHPGTGPSLPTRQPTGIDQSSFPGSPTGNQRLQLRSALHESPPFRRPSRPD